MALKPELAPKTVNSFVFLARNGYYDGLNFHRIIPGFVLQGGCPEGSGRGGPGYQFEDELPAPGRYEIGSLAMANAGPNTNGSQFFIISGQDGVRLPPQYSLFGQVISGLDVVAAIEATGSRSGIDTAAGVASASGTSTQKIEPSFSRLSTPIVPPMSSTSVFAIVVPRPLPP